MITVRLLAVIVCFTLGLLALIAPSSSAIAEAPDDEFLRALPGRPLVFPQDHGSHPRAKTEWWYLTGVLERESDGGTLGFQATWFRRALVPNAATRTSRLATRDLLLFHGAITDVDAGSFSHDSLGTRAAPGWGHAKEGTLDVSVFGRSLRLEDDGSWTLRSIVRGAILELRLVPTRDPLLHGEEPGLSLKGPLPGQASHYYSMTRLEATGTLRASADAPAQAVRGRVWFDQEFGSQQLGDDQIGWDWFSVALDDGTDLMLYQLRLKDGGIEPKSSGTIRTADGRRIPLSVDQFRIEVLDRWTSPSTGATYPARWRLTVPEHSIELEVRPRLPEQELLTQDTTGVDYWEGISEYTGSIAGRAVRAHGYVELVGYAGKFSGI